jgi:hypothetical protein
MMRTPAIHDHTEDAPVFDVEPELARRYARQDCEAMVDRYNRRVRDWSAAAHSGQIETAARLHSLLEACWPPPVAIARAARLLGSQRPLTIAPEPQGDPPRYGPSQQRSAGPAKRLSHLV